MLEKYDYIIVGGGLVGMLTAQEMANSGATIAILDKSDFGQESSWAGGGILSPLYPWRYDDAITLLANWGAAHYKKFAQELKSETGVDPECVNSGLLMLDIPEQEKENAEVWASNYQGVMTFISQKECIGIEPQLDRTKFDSAVWMPEIYQIRNPYFVKSLKTSLQINKKVDLFENYEMTNLITKENKVIGCETNRGSFYADNTIIAGGAWSAKILKDQSTIPKIEPVKGQMLLFKGNAGVLKRIILSNEHYVIPRNDGHILVGSTLEKTGFDKNTTEKAKSELLLEAERIVPAIKSMQLVKHWAGLRPGSPEGIPYIGKYPLMDNLYINSGHFRYGVILGLASARLLSDILLERKKTFPQNLYSFER